jgi:predicted Zn-dependent peptidase
LTEDRGLRTEDSRGCSQEASRRRSLESAVLSPQSSVGVVIFWFLLAALPLHALERRLPNGALIVVEPRTSTETVAIRLIIGGGNLDTAASPAVARLHAAMLLRGTRERDGFALARAGEELGGRLTAVSRPLCEIVSITVPAENAEAAIRLVAETLLSPRFDPADLEKEKNLLVGTLATERDQPSTHRRDEVLHTLFTGHPLDRLALPSDAQVRAVPIDSVRLFHRGRVKGGHLALIAIGRIEPDRATALARELLAIVPAGDSLTSHGIEHPVLPAPRPLATDVSGRVSKRTTQAELTVALPTEGLAQAERPVFALLSHVLGGFQERLYSEIREKRGLAYSIDAGGENFPGAGFFEVTTGAKKEKLADIEKLVRSELQRLVDAPVTSDELTRAVRYLKTSEARRDATNAGRASVLTEEILWGAVPESYEERVARLESVTPGQIQTLARRLFAGKHVAAVKMY